MKSVDIVFCVLTYKNSTDLEEFLSTLQNNKRIKFSYDVVIVNSFADKESLAIIKDIAHSYNCVFLECENKGYGFGNNVGIKYIKENFKYKFLAVCNPDTIIKEFNFESIKMHEDKIIAPKVSTPNRRNQNPLDYRYLARIEKILYKGYKQNKISYILFGQSLRKLVNGYYKMFVSFQKSDELIVNSAHGCFVVFGHKAVDRLYPIYDENMFLFTEERDLSRKAKSLDVKTIFIDKIAIFHKEDGSMNISGFDLNQCLSDSYVYYHEKWAKKG